MTDLEKAKDPNTSFDDLYLLAHNFPNEVLENPILPLLSIENPNKWKDLINACYLTLSIVSFNMDNDREAAQALLKYFSLGGDGNIRIFQICMHMRSPSGVYDERTKNRVKELTELI